MKYRFACGDCFNERKFESNLGRLVKGCPECGGPRVFYNNGVAKEGD